MNKVLTIMGVVITLLSFNTNAKMNRLSRKVKDDYNKNDD
jgi:hypothetical protein